MHALLLNMRISTTSAPVILVFIEQSMVFGGDLCCVSSWT